MFGAEDRGRIILDKIFISENIFLANSLLSNHKTCEVAIEAEICQPQFAGIKPLPKSSMDTTIYLASLMCFLSFCTRRTTRAAFVIRAEKAKGPGSTKHIKQIFLGRCWSFQQSFHYQKDCDNLWRLFSRAFANKDPCDVSTEDYEKFFKEAAGSPIDKVRNKNFQTIVTFTFEFVMTTRSSTVSLVVHRRTATRFNPRTILLLARAKNLVVFVVKSKGCKYITVTIKLLQLTCKPPSKITLGK